MKGKIGASIVGAIALVLMTTMVVTGAAGEGWPMSGGNGQHSGHNGYDASHNYGDIKWKFIGTEHGMTQLTSQSLGQPSLVVFSDGTIYTTADDQIYAIRDGKLLWVKSIPIDSDRYRPLLPPAIGANGTIYVCSTEGALYAMDTYGSQVWRYDAGNNISTSPSIGPDGTIYIATAMTWDNSTHYLLALNEDGTLRWKSEIDSSYGNNIAIGDDGTTYIATVRTKANYQDPNGSFLRAIDTEGNERWNFSLGNVDASSPIVGEDGRIYVYAQGTHADQSYDLFAIWPDGTLDWRYDHQEDSAFMGKPANDPAVAHDGSVYIPSGDQMVALNSNGTERWTYQIENGWVSTPVIAKDGSIYFGTLGMGHSIGGDGFAYAMSPDGEVKWSKVICAGTPSAAAMDEDGTLYFAGIGYRTASGEIIALNGGFDPAVVLAVQIMVIGSLSVVAIFLAIKVVRSRMGRKRDGP